MGLSRRISVENRCPFCPRETSPHCFAAEKVGDAAAVAPSSFLTTAILGTNATFVLKNIYLLPILFDRDLN
jgi:hypothetical protein